MNTYHIDQQVWVSVEVIAASEDEASDEAGGVLLDLLEECDGVEAYLTMSVLDEEEAA